MDTNQERDAELNGFRNWVAGRKDAAAKIDIETCELWWQHRCTPDPYGLFEAEGTLTEEERQIGRVFFARSPESDGPVCAHDLSEAQVAAMWARVDHGDPREFDLLTRGSFFAVEASEV